MQTAYCGVAVRRTWTVTISVSCCFLLLRLDSILCWWQTDRALAEASVFYVVFKRWREISHCSRSANVGSKIFYTLMNFLFNPGEYFPPFFTGCFSTETGFICSSVPAEVCVCTCIRTPTRASTHTAKTHSLHHVRPHSCKPLPWWLQFMFELSITLQQKHLSLVLSLCVSLSLSTMSLLLSRPPSSSVSSTLQLSQNMQSGKKMKTFAMDCTRDAVCTLVLQQLVGAGRSGFSETLGHLWDLGTV